MESPDTVASGSPGSVHARAAGASVVQVEHSRLLPWLMFCCILSGVAVAVSCIGFYMYTLTERQVQLMKIQQEMTNAWLARAGLVEPMDTFNGPEGNVFHKPRKEK